jgi:uncharacterized protein YjbI with pentapeptide repeats
LIGRCLSLQRGELIKKCNIIFVPSVILAATLLISGTSHGFNQKDLDTVIATKQCEKCDLSDADFSGANLKDAKLSACYLSNANLGSANLAQANLQGAQMAACLLPEANLSGADLSGADLSPAPSFFARTSPAPT